MLKRIIGILLCTMIVLMNLSIGAQGLSYCNDFDPDLFTSWKAIGSGGGTPQNTMSFRNAAGEGYQGGDAKAIGFNRTNNDIGWGGSVEALLPTNWDLSTVSWLNFMVKGNNAEPLPTSMSIKFLDASETELGVVAFTSTDNDWEHIVLPVSNLAGAVKIKIYDNAKGREGELLFDNVTFTDTQPERIDIYRPVTIVNTFDPNTFATPTVYAGFKNNAATYFDYIKTELVSNAGKTGNAYRLYYSSATWYSGEVFIAKPADWSMRYVTHFEFDVKGTGVVKINFSTGQIVNGTRYEYKITINSDDWTHIAIPLSSFKRSGVSVDKESIVGLSFQAGENGNLNNNLAATKEMTKEELEAKARIGNIYFDNMALTNTPHTGLRVSKSGISQNSVPLQALSNAVKGDVTFRVDFQNYESTEISSTIVVALYSKSTHKMQGIYFAQKGILAEDYIEKTVYIDSPASLYAKIFVLDNLGGIRPVDDRYVPLTL